MSSSNFLLYCSFFKFEVKNVEIDYVFVSCFAFVLPLDLLYLVLWFLVKMRGRSGGVRQDVREMKSRNRFMRLAQHDPDILPSRQDDDDQEHCEWFLRSLEIWFCLAFQVRVNRQTVHTINRHVGGQPGGGGLQRMGPNRYNTQNNRRVTFDKYEIFDSMKCKPIAFLWVNPSWGFLTLTF